MDGKVKRLVVVALVVGFCFHWIPQFVEASNAMHDAVPIVGARSSVFEERKDFSQDDNAFSYYAVHGFIEAGEGALHVYCISNKLYRVVKTTDSKGGKDSLVDGISLLSKNAITNMDQNWFLQGLKFAQMAPTCAVFYVFEDSVDVFKRAVSMARMLGVDAYAGCFYTTNSLFPLHVTEQLAGERKLELSEQERISVLASYDSELCSMLIGLELQLIVNGKHAEFQDREPVSFYVVESQAFLKYDSIPKDLQIQLRPNRTSMDSLPGGFHNRLPFRDDLISLSEKEIDQLIESLKEKRNSYYIILQSFPPVTRLSPYISNKAQDNDLDVIVVF